MRVGKEEYSEILITDNEGNLIASITDDDIIESHDYKVVCVPIEN